MRSVAFLVAGGLAILSADYGPVHATSNQFPVMPPPAPSVVLSENQNFGSSLGQPTGIFQPRVLRISSNMKF